MGDRGAVYDLLQDFGFKPNEDGVFEVTTSVHWVIAVIRLGTPLSFDRSIMSSVSKNLSAGALLRAEKPLVITDDCYQITISKTKADHRKRLTAALKQTDVNYLAEIKTGDWVFAWLVNNETDFKDLVAKIEAGKQANEFNSGLKFMGRATSVRKVGVRDEHQHVASYNLQCGGFEELDSNLFYDNSLASSDVLEKDIGQWLTRLGVDVQKLFGYDADSNIEPNNINRIIPTILDLIVGAGPGARGEDGVIGVAAADDKTVAAEPQFTETAPYAYVAPIMAGQLLGKGSADVSRHVMAYADLLELVQGVQSYSNKEGTGMFVPDLKSADSTPTRRVCSAGEMLGTFLPFLPDLANKPMWTVFQQFLNPVINEIYTCMRVNSDGNIVPTMVFRQIPFTTDAFQQTGALGPKQEGPLLTGDDTRNIQAVTRFLDLPRWGVPTALIKQYDIGCSDANRINMVHVYGTSSYQINAISASEQIVNSPPVFDHLDAMRSGMRPYFGTVECWVDQTVGHAPSAWINLAADWLMGAHLTLNGTIICYGIQSPICEGDNLEFDGVVYHIESVIDHAQMDLATGKKTWITTIGLTNGMRKEAPGELRSDQGKYPIYPGVEIDDNRALDPGLSVEQQRTTGGASATGQSFTDSQQPTPLSHDQINDNLASDKDLLDQF